MNYFDTLIAKALSGGGGIKKLHEEDIEVSTTSTSAVTIKDIDITGLPVEGDTDKLVYVRIRDKAGWRTGYHYGTDNLCSPTAIWAGAGTNSVCGIRYYCYDSSGTINKFSAGQSTQYGVYVGSLSTLGGIRIQARYNSSSSRTIDGTFNVQVYVIPMKLFS